MKEKPQSKKRKVIHESSGHVPKSLSHSNTYFWGRNSSLYLRVITLDGKPRWDYFNLNKEYSRGNEERVVTLLNEVDDSGANKFAVVESLIYCVFEEGQDVAFLDTKRKNSELFWGHTPHMISRRFDCAVVSLHGKIYVMGGVDENCHGAWGEYLSPGSKNWCSLPDPPRKDIGILGLFISAFRKRSKIVVGSLIDRGSFIDRSMYLYDVRGHSWKKLDVNENHVPRAYRSPPIVAGNILYWFRYQKLYAYDLETNKSAYGFIEGVKTKYLLLSECYQLGPKLIYIGGGKLCLITHQMYGTKKDTSTVRLFLFDAPEITSQDEWGSLHAHVLDSYKYDIQDSNGIIDALLM